MSQIQKYLEMETPRIKCDSTQFKEDYVSLDKCLTECYSPCIRFIELDGFNEEQKAKIDLFIAAIRAATVNDKKKRESRYVSWKARRSRRK